MFPPQKTDDPYTLLQNVLGSLGRAGGGFRQDVLVDTEDQELRVTVGLTDSIPKPARDALRTYLREYAKESGWCVKNISLKRAYVRFRLRKASDKDS